jgi:hypothetical protein
VIGAALLPRLLVVGGIAVLALGAWQWAEHRGREQGRNEVQVKWDADKLQRAAAYAKALEERDALQARERDRERMWSDIARSIDNDGLTRERAQRVARDRAVAGHGELQHTLDAIVADRAAADRACADSAATGRREAAGETARVFSELLATCHRESIARAGYADAAAAAGLSAERWGDSVETKR